MTDLPAESNSEEQGVSGEVAKPGRPSEEQLAAINNLDDARAFLEAQGISVESIAEYGSGFEVAEKNRLIGNPFIVVDGKVNHGEYGDFVSLLVVTKANEKLIINDGSTGIYHQCLELLTHRKTLAGVVCAHGLRKSTYPIEIDGSERQATTYYLDTSR